MSSGNNKKKVSVSELSKGDVILFDVPVVAKGRYETNRKEILRKEYVVRDGKEVVKLEFVEDGDRGIVASWKFCSFGEEFRVVGSDC